MDKFEGALHAESGSLFAYLGAYSGTGAQVIAYYFKTEEQAAKCREGQESVYKLVGYSLVYGDEENILH